MDLNDGQLTPAERDDLRARLLSGAKRIKPVGAHRRAIVTTTVAVVLVAGLSAGAIGAANFLRMGDHVAPISTPTPSVSSSATPTPTPTPTPAPTPTSTTSATPRVAFDGDCARALSAADLDGVIGTGASLYDTEMSFSTTTSAEAALLGGVMCTWMGERDILEVSVFDAAVVSEAVAQTYAALQCSSSSVVCETGRVVKGMWIGAGVTPAVEEPWIPLTEAEAARESARLQQVIDDVAAKLAPGAAVATAPAPTWWGAPDCAAMQAVVEGVVGAPMIEGAEQGAAGRQGMTWEIRQSAGVESNCWFHDPTENARAQVQVRMTSGVGVPPRALLGSESVLERSVPGADAAWSHFSIDTPYADEIAALSGSNLVTISIMSNDEVVTTAEALATAVISELR